MFGVKEGLTPPELTTTLTLVWNSAPFGYRKSRMRNYG